MNISDSTVQRITSASIYRLINQSLEACVSDSLYVYPPCYQGVFILAVLQRLLMYDDTNECSYVYLRFADSLQKVNFVHWKCVYTSQLSHPNARVH